MTMPINPKIELERSPGYMLGLTYRKLSSLLQQRLKAYDITPEQWSVLLHISRGNGMIQKDIAEQAGKDHPTTTRILDQLLKKGFVTKQTDPNDRRAFLVFSTPEGQQLLEETIAIEHSVTKEVQDCMTEQDFSKFMELLHRLNAHAAYLINSPTK